MRGITKQMALERRLDSVEGVLVAGVQGGGLAEAAGLAANDVVRLVEEHPVADLESFKNVYQDVQATGKDRIMLKIKRRDSSRYLLLKLGSQEG